MKIEFEKYTAKGITWGYVSPTKTFSYDTIKDNLFIRVVNNRSVRHNNLYVERCPHRQIADLYLIPFVLIGKDNDGVLSYPIMHSIKECLDVSDDELINQAILSGMKLFPEKIDTMENILMDADCTPNEDSDVKMIVVSNESGVNGASAMFYPGVMEKVSMMLGGNFYAIPSSIHEFIVIPSNNGKENFSSWLNGIIKNINRTMVNPDEVLSNHAYYYNSKKKVFESC